MDGGILRLWPNRFGRPGNRWKGQAWVAPADRAGITIGRRGLYRGGNRRRCARLSTAGDPCQPFKQQRADPREPTLISS